MAHCH